MTPFIEILIGWILIALCAVGAVYGKYLVDDGNVRNKKSNIALNINSNKSRSNETAIIDITKLKINRALYDFDDEFRNISESFPKNSDKNAAYFNSHGTLTSGIFIQSQMDLSVSTKRLLDKEYETLKRNIENILVDSFGKTSLDLVGPEFNDQKQRFNNAKEKCMNFYNVLNSNPKSWEMRALNRSDLTKNFDVSRAN